MAQAIAQAITPGSQKTLKHHTAIRMMQETGRNARGAQLSEEAMKIIRNLPTVGTTVAQTKTMAEALDDLVAEDIMTDIEDFATAFSCPPNNCQTCLKCETGRSLVTLNGQ